MIEKISNKLLNYLISSHKIKNDNEIIDYYRYGIEITISSILNIVLIISIGVVTKNIMESLMFLLCFIPLRQVTGGYHAETYFKCNLLFVIVFCLLLVIYKMSVEILTNYAVIMMLIFSLTIFITECPIENMNKPLNEEQKKINKKKAIILGTLYGCIGVLSKVLSYDIGVIFLYTLVLIAILVIAAMIKNRKGELK